MKCEYCKFKKIDTLLFEANDYEKFEYCEKKHWEESYTLAQFQQQEIEIQLNPNVDLWINCKDYCPSSFSKIFGEKL